MIKDLVEYSDRDLDDLLAAIVHGGTGANRRLSCWPDLIGAFGSLDGVAAAIRLLRAERRRSRREEGRPEIILSGPGTETSPTRDTRVAVREIFDDARRTLLIVGYAFHAADRIFEPLAQRMARDEGLTVRIVVDIRPQTGKTAAETARRFSADFVRSTWPFHPRPEVYYLPSFLDLRAAHRSSVHAKLIVADSESIYLGSANFTSAAFDRNIEAGLRLRCPALGRQLSDHFDRLIGTGVLAPLDLGPD